VEAGAAARHDEKEHAMQLGIFTQYIHTRSVEELAARIRQHGLDSVVLDSYPGLEIDLDDPSPGDCRRIRAAFAAEQVAIAAVGGYSNLIHPDPAARRAIHRRLGGLMRLCAEIGAPMLCSETGTYHPRSDWDWDPANATPQAFDLLVETLRPLAATAQEYGVTLGLEPYVMNVGYTAERAVGVVAQLGTPNVKLVADPAGLLTRATLDVQAEVLPPAFEAMGPHLGLVHVEDCRPDPDGHFLWLAAGRGLIDYPLFMRLVVGTGYRGPLILEHLSEEDIPPVSAFVRARWRRALEEGAL
jgi:sugar phosphate isomerase/epimerase